MKIHLTKGEVEIPLEIIVKGIAVRVYEIPDSCYEYQGYVALGDGHTLEVYALKRGHQFDTGASCGFEAGKRPQYLYL
jgi:hypothetical protein